MWNYVSEHTHTASNCSHVNCWILLKACITRGFWKRCPTRSISSIATLSRNEALEGDCLLATVWGSFSNSKSTRRQCTAHLSESPQSSVSAVYALRGKFQRNTAKPSIPIQTDTEGLRLLVKTRLTRCSCDRATGGQQEEDSSRGRWRFPPRNGLWWGQTPALPCPRRCADGDLQNNSDLLGSLRVETNSDSAETDLKHCQITTYSQKVAHETDQWRIRTFAFNRLTREILLQILPAVLQLQAEGSLRWCGRSKCKMFIAILNVDYTHGGMSIIMSCRYL